MLLTEPQLISLVHNKVGFEGHVQRNKHSKIGEQCDVSQLESSDPFKYSSVFVNNFPLLEVEVLAGILSGHFDERLVEESGVEDVLLKFEKSVDWSSEEFRVAESVADVGIFIFGFDCHIVLISFSVVVVMRNGTVESLFLPLDDVLERSWSIPGCIRDEAVLVGKSPDLFVVIIASGESEIGERLFLDAVGIEVCINAGNTFLVGPVEFGDCVPHLALDLEVVFEVVNDGVVGLNLNLIVVLVELVVDVVG